MIAPGAPLRILCVDDDPDIRTITAMALGLDSGMTVRSAGSAAEMMAILGEEGRCPDAILLDVMMPDTDGLGALARIRAHGCTDVPVIFMTARARQADIDTYLAAGAVGVIVKPFDPLGLAAELRRLIERA